MEFRLNTNPITELREVAQTTPAMITNICNHNTDCALILFFATVLAGNARFPNNTTLSEKEKSESCDFLLSELNKLSDDTLTAIVNALFVSTGSVTVGKRTYSLFTLLEGLNGSACNNSSPSLIQTLEHIFNSDQHKSLNNHPKLWANIYNGIDTKKSESSPKNYNYIYGLLFCALRLQDLNKIKAATTQFIVNLTYDVIHLLFQKSRADAAKSMIGLLKEAFCLMLTDEASGFKKALNNYLDHHGHDQLPFFTLFTHLIEANDPHAIQIRETVTPLFFDFKKIREKLNAHLADNKLYGYLSLANPHVLSAFLPLILPPPPPLSDEKIDAQVDDHVLKPLSNLLASSRTTTDLIHNDNCAIITLLTYYQSKRPASIYPVYQEMLSESVLPRCSGFLPLNGDLLQNMSILNFGRWLSIGEVAYLRHGQNFFRELFLPNPQTAADWEKTPIYALFKLFEKKPGHLALLVEGLTRNNLLFHHRPHSVQLIDVLRPHLMKLNPDLLRSRLSNYDYQALWTHYYSEEHINISMLLFLFLLKNNDGFNGAAFLAALTTANPNTLKVGLIASHGITSLSDVLTHFNVWRSILAFYDPTHSEKHVTQALSALLLLPVAPDELPIAHYLIYRLFPKRTADNTAATANTITNLHLVIPRAVQEHIVSIPAFAGCKLQHFLNTESFLPDAESPNQPIPYYRCITWEGREMNEIHHMITPAKRNFKTIFTRILLGHVNLAGEKSAIDEIYLTRTPFASESAHKNTIASLLLQAHYLEYQNDPRFAELLETIIQEKNHTILVNLYQTITEDIPRFHRLLRSFIEKIVVANGDPLPREARKFLASLFVPEANPELAPIMPDRLQPIASAIASNAFPLHYLEDLCHMIADPFDSNSLSEVITRRLSVKSITLLANHPGFPDLVPRIFSEATTAHHFSELSQRIIRALSKASVYGNIDNKLHDENGDNLLKLEEGDNCKNLFLHRIASPLDEEQGKLFIDTVLHDPRLYCSLLQQLSYAFTMKSRTLPRDLFRILIYGNGDIRDFTQKTPLNRLIAMSNLATENITTIYTVLSQLNPDGWAEALIDHQKFSDISNATIAPFYRCNISFPPEVLQSLTQASIPTLYREGSPAFLTALITNTDRNKSALSCNDLLCLEAFLDNPGIPDPASLLASWHFDVLEKHGVAGLKRLMQSVFAAPNNAGLSKLKKTLALYEKYNHLAEVINTIKDRLPYIKALLFRERNLVNDKNRFSILLSLHALTADIWRLLPIGPDEAPYFRLATLLQTTRTMIADCQEMAAPASEQEKFSFFSNKMSALFMSLARQLETKTIKEFIEKEILTKNQNIFRAGDFNLAGDLWQLIEDRGEDASVFHEINPKIRGFESLACLNPQPPLIDQCYLQKGKPPSDFFNDLTHSLTKNPGVISSLGQPSKWIEKIFASAPGNTEICTLLFGPSRLLWECSISRDPNQCWETVFDCANKYFDGNEYFDFFRRVMTEEYFASSPGQQPDQSLIIFLQRTSDDTFKAIATELFRYLNELSDAQFIALTYDHDRTIITATRAGQRYQAILDYAKTFLSEEKYKLFSNRPLEILCSHLHHKKFAPSPSISENRLFNIVEEMDNAAFLADFTIRNLTVLLSPDYLGDKSMCLNSTISTVQIVKILARKYIITSRDTINPTVYQSSEKMLIEINQAPLNTETKKRLLAAWSTLYFALYDIETETLPTQTMRSSHTEFKKRVSGILSAVITENKNQQQQFCRINKETEEFLASFSPIALSIRAIGFNYMQHRLNPAGAMANLLGMPPGIVDIIVSYLGPFSDSAAYPWINRIATSVPTVKTYIEDQTHLITAATQLANIYLRVQQSHCPNYPLNFQEKVNHLLHLLKHLVLKIGIVRPFYGATDIFNIAAELLTVSGDRALWRASWIAEMDSTNLESAIRNLKSRNLFGTGNRSPQSTILFNLGIFSEQPPPHHQQENPVASFTFFKSASQASKRKAPPSSPDCKEDDKEANKKNHI